MSKSLSAATLVVATLLTAAALPVWADPIPCAPTIPSDAKSGEKVWRYQPNQLCPPQPKYEYTDEGRAIMVKRYPYFAAQDVNHFQKYRYYENKYGVEHIEKACKIKREPDEILSEEQKTIIREWGQPDYLRGPYKSTRGDSVIEWIYHPTNHLFQFVDRTMVYEGPLTDQERTALVYGAPREVIVNLLEPNIRRETWQYKAWFRFGREMMFSFANGKLIYENTSY